MLSSRSTSPHIHSGNDVGQLMQTVLLALLPGIAIYVGLFGWGVVSNILIAVIAALAFEAIMLQLRNRPVAPFLSDRSSILTAVLLAIAIPPMSPWWLIVTGIFFAIVMAKHLYGGLGYNPFNPAMIGYVVLLISFPKEMTDWLPPVSLSDYSINLATAVKASFGYPLGNGHTVDSLTMATPLDSLKTQLTQQHVVSDIFAGNQVFGYFGGIGWQWVSLGYLAGGIWLVSKKVIDWRIPLGMLSSLLLIASLFWLMDGDHYASPLFHLLSGATILGAFFIATDPITASTTTKGRLLYGAGIGILVYIIRSWGGYPDGVAFAVLLMNIAAPTLDYYTKPLVFGRGK